MILHKVLSKDLGRCCSITIYKNKGDEKLSYIFEFYVQFVRCIKPQSNQKNICENF